MPGDYEKAISIKEAIDHITNRDYLLPAIQRNFVWSTHQICVLFDSIMRGYPINTFMMWDISSPQIKEDYRFYEFLKTYCQRFGENNPHFETRSHKNFKAIIDGQQRLTSLYIGLNGTYAYKQPRVWWPTIKDDNILPPRKLYLDLLKPAESDDNLMEFNFRFLTAEEYSASIPDSVVHWYEVGRILVEPEVGSIDEIYFKVVIPLLQQQGLANNEFAMKTLTRLYVALRNEKLIHFFKETSQEIDHVLDVFIRTNSGGTSLSFSDLLMSIAVANWKGDARDDIDSLTQKIWQSSEMGFSVDRDWILKACLTLTDSDVRFRVKNFNAAQVEKIEAQWPDLRDCITEAFKLMRLIGLKDQSLRAKNAVIPIAYYLYRREWNGKPLFRSINNLAYHIEERREVGRWLHMALLKGVFGGQSDGMITKMRKLINENSGELKFPLKQIVEAYRGTNKDLRFDGEYISNLLAIQYGDHQCRSVLSLLYPEVNENQLLHIDHLHPKSGFTMDELKKHQFLNDAPGIMEFYDNAAHWNSLPNLHLLNASQNCSKNDVSLKDWILNSNNGFRREDLLLSPEQSLEFEDFHQFYQARLEALQARLRDKLYIVDHSLTNVTAEMSPEDDEQV